MFLNRHVNTWVGSYYPSVRRAWGMLLIIVGADTLSLFHIYVGIYIYIIYIYIYFRKEDTEMLCQHAGVFFWGGSLLV